MVHTLDRFVPELERYLVIEDIGCFLIAEGLLNNDEYLTLVRYSSKKKAVVDLLHLIKSKGPDCMKSFLHALQRSCTETSTPHQGHLHLWELFQTNITMTDSHPLKKQKSKSILSLFGRTKRNKNSKHKVNKGIDRCCILVVQSVHMSMSLKTKTHGSELQGQEAACMCIFGPMQLLII